MLTDLAGGMLAAASANASALGLTNVGIHECDVDDLPFGGRRHPIGEPLRGHDGRVEAVAGEALPDGTPVIISGSWDGTVRVWRLADGTPIE